MPAALGITPAAFREAFDAHGPKPRNVAAGMGTSEQTVRRWMRKLEIEVGPVGRPRKIDPAKILALRNRQLTYGQIGLKLGCSASYACQVVARLQAGKRT